MVTIDIKENIRFFKPNDPYYYEVDNLPLIDLLNNDKILRDEINLILTGNANYASEAYVITNLQAAIGDVGEVDIDGDGVTPAYTDVISWVVAQGYLSEAATNIGDLLDVDTTTVSPTVGNTLVYDTAQNPAKWVPGSPNSTVFLAENYWLAGEQPDRNASEYFSNAYNLYNELRTHQGNQTYGDPNNPPMNFVKYFTATLAEMGIPQGAKSILYNSGISSIGTASTDLAHYLFHKQGMQHSGNGDVAHVNFQKIWGQGGGDAGQTWDIQDSQIYLQDPTKTEIEIYSNVSTANGEAPKSSGYPKVYFFVYGYTI